MTNGIVAFLASGYNIAQISGQTVSIAGSITTTAGVSGQTVYLVNNGINNIVAISGQAVSIAANAISGQTVYLVNDGINNIVQNSGQTFRLPNDGLNNIISMSGQTVQISLLSGMNRIQLGSTSIGSVLSMNQASNDATATTNTFAEVKANLQGFHRTNNTFARIDAVTPFSGEGYRLLVANSGQVSYEFGTVVKTAGGTVITALSGGTLLTNISGFSFLLRNNSGNSTMMVGGLGSNSPDVIGISGIGLPLYGGDSLTLKVSNLNQVRVLAGVSGQVLSWLVVDR